MRDESKKFYAHKCPHLSHSWFRNYAARQQHKKLFASSADSLIDTDHDWFKIAACFISRSLMAVVVPCGRYITRVFIAAEIPLARMPGWKQLKRYNWDGRGYDRIGEFDVSYEWCSHILHGKVVTDSLPSTAPSLHLHKWLSVNNLQQKKTFVCPKKCFSCAFDEFRTPRGENDRERTAASSPLKTMFYFPYRAYHTSLLQQFK